MSGDFTSLATPAEGAASAGTVTLSVTAATGQPLVAAIQWDRTGGVTLSSVSDPTNGTWTAAPSTTLNDTTNNVANALYYFANPASGTYTVTATFSTGTPFRILAIFQGSVLAAGGALDGSNGAQQSAPGTGTDALTVSLTNAAQPAVILAATSDNGGTATPAAGTGATSKGTAGATFGVPAYVRYETKRVTTTGSQAATFTAGASSGSDIFHTIAVAFDEPVVAVQQVTRATFAEQLALGIQPHWRM